MKRALTLLLISIITIASTYALVRYIKNDTFSFAWILNFMLMSFVSFFTQTLKSPLTSGYFNERKWERGGKIYEGLGINMFRKILVWIGWEKLLRKVNPVEKNNEALDKLHYQTKISELNHLIIFFIVLGFNIFVVFKYGVTKSLSLLLLNIILHVYPILLQRFNRPRLERVLKLSKRNRTATITT